MEPAKNVKRAHNPILWMAYWFLTLVTFTFDPLLGLIFLLSDHFDEKRQTGA